MGMWQRGEVFWQWADATLHHRTHNETLACGCAIDVQVRLSRIGDTQLFIGIYGREGLRLHEESHDRLPGSTMSRALLWGVAKAREMAGTLAVEPLPVAAQGSSAASAAAPRR